MFDKNATYQKSALGAEAIATRSSLLTPKLRTMLIMVDGKRSWNDLAKLGEAEQLLPQLAQLGFIEPLGGARPAAPAAGAGAPQAQAPAQAARPAVTLQEAKRIAVRLLNDLLGPGSDDLCIRIEGTRTPQEFQAAIQKTESLLRQFVGNQKAEKFSAAMQAHRPA